jgi:hypothetical protein
VVEVIGRVKTVTTISSIQPLIWGVAVLQIISNAIHFNMSQMQLQVKRVFTHIIFLVQSGRSTCCHQRADYAGMVMEHSQVQWCHPSLSHPNWENKTLQGVMCYIKSTNTSAHTWL